MKSNFFFSIIFFFSFALATSAQTAPAATTGMTTKFKVYGNCGMCEKRIEKAASIEGVTSAEWDVETLFLTVQFDPTKVKPGKIHKAVAAVGHDTDKVRAEDAVYEDLHGCCKYERPVKE